MVLKSTFPDVEIPQVPIAQYALEKMEHFGNSVALVDPYHDQSWTFSQLRQQSIEFAVKLRSIGVEKGDVVGLVVDFHPKCFPMILGIILCKATLATGNINAVPKDIAKQMKHVNAKFCICEEHGLQQELKSELEQVDIYDLDFFKASGDSASEKALEEILSSSGVDLHEDPLTIVFTSGSTGQPKALVVTNASFMASMAIYESIQNLKPAECMLTVCKQLHLFGFWSFFTHIVLGVKHIVAPNLQPELFSHCVKIYGVNGAIISDYVTFNRITNEALLENIYALRFIRVGGASTPKELMQKASDKFHVAVTSGYGSSEGGMATCSPTSQTPFESVGMLCPNVQLKVIDVDNGTDLGPCKQGEFFVKSPGVFKGYLNDKEATDAVLDKCGWFRTGDLGYYDEQGFVYVVDRLKNVIKSHGNMAVFPTQLEEVLLSHPGVAEAVVVRTTHPVYNEAAKGFVVKKDECLTKEELLKFYNAQVAEYQQLFGGLEFIDQIPKTGLGKPKKTALESL